MKEQIQNTLQQLIGLELTRTTRAVDMECLKFGFLEKEIKGKKYNIGLFDLHIQTPWRIIKEDKILVGSSDVYKNPNQEIENDEEFNWEEDNLRDQQLKQLITEKLIVQNVKADSLGGCEIIFNNNIILQAFPNSSKTDDRAEFWRLLKNTSAKAEHFVVGGFGIER